MVRSRSGSGAAVFLGGTVVALACLLLPGCASAERTGTAQVPAGAAADGLNRTYTVTCDGIVPDGFRATVVDGSARIPADGSRPPHYEYYDIRVTATAGGDVDGDAAPDTVVLLDCSPQPSNGVVQEVQIFSSTGRPLGALPSPRTLQRGVHPPPVYDPAGLSVQDGEIVAAMTDYGPDDSHASGPSVPLTVRWRFNGQEFVRASS
jgi:hypothetical protein